MGLIGKLFKGLTGLRTGLAKPRGWEEVFASKGGKFIPTGEITPPRSAWDRTGRELDWRANPVRKRMVARHEAASRAVGHVAAAQRMALGTVTGFGIGALTGDSDNPLDMFERGLKGAAVGMGVGGITTWAKLGARGLSAAGSGAGKAGKWALFGPRASTGGRRAIRLAGPNHVYSGRAISGSWPVRGGKFRSLSARGRLAHLSNRPGILSGMHARGIAASEGLTGMAGSSAYVGGALGNSPLLQAGRLGGKAIGGVGRAALSTVEHHPGLVAGTLAAGGVYSAFSGPPEPPPPPEPRRRGRSGAQMLRSSTDGLTQGLHSSRHGGS